MDIHNKKRVAKRTGNVEASVLLLVAFILITLVLVGGRGHVLATERFCKDLGVADGDGVDKDTATDVERILVAERLEERGEEKTKDEEVLDDGGRAAGLALDVLDDLVEAVRRDIDEYAPWDSPEELGKELSLEDLEERPEQRVFPMYWEEKRVRVC